MPDFDKVTTDILILGGGVQGTWILLDLLDKGYDALLLERDQPGAGQTGHSHLFLHKGHLFAWWSGDKADFRESALARVRPLRTAFGLWEHALQNGRLKGLQTCGGDFLIGWQTAEAADAFWRVCNEAEIDIKRAPDASLPDHSPPPEGGRIYSAEGICLESRKLIDHLLDLNNGRARARVARFDKLKFAKAGVEGVCARISRGKEGLDICFRGLVLAAGGGNEQLSRDIGLAIGNPLSWPEARQQTVKTFMLVVKAKGGGLKPACGMFRDFHGIFYASRVCQDGQVLLLIADRQRHHVGVPGEWTALSARAWYQRLKLELRNLFPSLFQSPDRYEWGIYEATKAEPWTENQRTSEGGAFPTLFKWTKHPIANVWAVWPSLLTFAPLASKEVASDIEATIQPVPAQPSADWSAFAAHTQSEKDRWQTTPLLDWASFQRSYDY